MEYNKIERIKKSSICIMIRVRGIKIIVEQHLKIHNQIMDGTHVQDVEENLGELRGLMWSDIDFKNKVIHVQRTMKYFHGKGTTLDSPKTESSNRDIPMLDNVY